MKKKVTIAVVFAAGVLVALPIVLRVVTSASASDRGRVNPPTHLVTISGNRLAKACQPGADGSFQDGICLGYVLAIADVINNGSINGQEACTPPGILNVQMQGVAQLYLADHPALLHHPAVELVAAALAEEFPCSSEHQTEPNDRQLR